MIVVLFAFVIGMLIGWNVLPQPAWVARLWARLAHRDRY